MGELARLQIDHVMYKVRIFERGSRRLDCVCCKEPKYGLLVRAVNPDKRDRLLCHDCLIKIIFGHLEVGTSLDEQKNLITELREEIKKKRRSLKIVRENRKEQESVIQAQLSELKGLRAKLSKKSIGDANDGAKENAPQPG